MKNLLPVLFALLIVACSSSTDPNEEPEYPKQIGTWEIASPDSAYWIGNNGSRKSFKSLANTDTMTIVDNANYNIQVKDHSRNSTYVELKIEFINEQDFEIIPLQEGLIPSTSFSLRMAGDAHDDSSEMTYVIAYLNCYPEDEARAIQEVKYLEQPVKHGNQDSTFYRFDIEGYVQTVREILECESS